LVTPAIATDCRQVASAPRFSNRTYELKLNWLHCHIEEEYLGLT
jgi:hypothetical protein